MTTVTQEAVRDGLGALLSTGVFFITFTKAEDNILRSLRVTLDPDLLPEVAPTAVATPFAAPVKRVRRGLPADVLSVYDLDSESWKSFIVANLISLAKVYT